MHLWQLCHLAMVVPIADAYYESDNPEKVEKEWKIMRKTAERLKRNFNFLRKQKGKLSPWEMNIFRFLPLPFLAIMLVVTFFMLFLQSLYLFRLASAFLHFFHISIKLLMQFPHFIWCLHSMLIHKFISKTASKCNCQHNRQK